MLVKIFSRGSGGGRAPCKYLLGGDGVTPERKGARVLSGDPATTIELIDGNNYARRYTSGVITFEEQADAFTDEQKRAIMESFETCMFAGLDADQYDVLWVEHKDKGGRLELNFVVPNVELTSGKRLQPYYHGRDKQRFGYWRDIINHEYGLADPNDPLRKRTLSTAKDLPRDKKEAAESITRGLEALVAAGAIKNRADVVAALTDAGITVDRQQDKYISIKSPSGGRNIRLRGALYEQDFRVSRDFRADIEAEGAEYRERAGERYATAQREYQERIEHYAERNRKQYPRPVGHSERGVDEHLTRETETRGNVALDSGIRRDVDRSGDVLSNHDTDAAHHRAAEPRRSAESVRGERYPMQERERPHPMRGSSAGSERLADRERGDGIHGNSAIRGTTHDRDREAVIERIRAAASRTRAHSGAVGSRLEAIERDSGRMHQAIRGATAGNEDVRDRMRRTSQTLGVYRRDLAARYEGNLEKVKRMKRNMDAAKKAQEAKNRPSRGFDMGR